MDNYIYYALIYQEENNVTFRNTHQHRTKNWQNQRSQTRKRKHIHNINSPTLNNAKKSREKNNTMQRKRTQGIPNRRQE